MSLICPSDRLALGLDEPTPDDPPPEWSELVTSPGLPRSGLLLEPDEHDEVMKWAAYQELFVLHAGTHKAVSDLPPGWPDFTLIYGARTCLVEMKVRLRFRMDQLRVIKRLADQDTPVFIARDSVQTIDHFKAWLLLNFNWRPKQ